MPYYIYRMFSFPIRRLEKLEHAPTFGAASARAKALRVAPDLPDGCAIKVIFAANELEAEDLLSQVRAPKPGLADDE